MRAKCSERRGRKFESSHSDQTKVDIDPKKIAKSRRVYVPPRKLQQFPEIPLNTIPLTKGFSAVIDEADAPLVREHLWCAMVVRGKVYAARRPGTKKNRRWVLLHRWLLNAPDGVDVDHINGDSLDNRRCNLRLATRSQNTANSNLVFGAIPFRGVSLDKQGKYRAQIVFQGSTKHLGTFQTPEAAHEAYQAKRVELFGEFAPS